MVYVAEGIRSPPHNLLANTQNSIFGAFQTHVMQYTTKIYMCVYLLLHTTTRMQRMKIEKYIFIAYARFPILYIWCNSTRLVRFQINNCGRYWLKISYDKSELIARYFQLIQTRHILVPLIFLLFIVLYYGFSSKYFIFAYFKLFPHFYYELFIL